MRPACAESVFKRLPAPPAAETLGWELIPEDPEAGTIEIAFHPGQAFLNPHGTVQGGFVAAMLDDTMGPALVSKTDGACIPSTLDMNVSFVRPVKPGPGDRQGPGRQPGQDASPSSRPNCSTRPASCSPAPPRPRGSWQRPDAPSVETPEGRSVRLLRVGEQVRHALSEHLDARRRP